MDYSNRILVVDDDDTIQKTIQLQLNNIGFKYIEAASDSIEALEKVKLISPDLILMDIKIAGNIDGIETASIINQSYTIPIIFLTAHTDEDLVNKAKKTSPYGYLIKPVRKHELKISLEMALYKYKVDKQLKINEERYRAIVEDQIELISRYDKQFNLTFINGAFCNYFGKLYCDLLGTSIFQFTDSFCKKLIESNIANISVSNPVNNIEHYISFPGKEMRWVFRTDRGIFDERGEIVEYQSVLFDISDKKRAEEELLTEKERLAVTLKSINDGVITLDMNCNVLLINKIAEDITGWSNKEAVGMPVEKLFKVADEKYVNLIINPIKQVLQTKQIIEVYDNLVIVDNFNRERLIEENVAPILNKNNDIIGVVLVLRDVTEKRKMEEEIQKTHKLESLGILAGGIAHDFNNIITGILGNISLAMLELESHSGVFSILNEAEKAVKRAKDLAQQLLTFAKGGAPVRRNTSIVDIVTHSANFVLRGSNVQCEFIVDHDLPCAEVDEAQISQVINNLIINADQAMPEGGKIFVNIEKTTLQNSKTMPLSDGDYILISIKDSGIGIHEKYLPKIFDPYFTTKQKGNGLGLAICYSIIKKHEGYITVESEVGHGTIFYIYLPASDKKPLLYNMEFDIKKGHGKVLVMDDEELVRNVYEKMLNYLGYNVEFAKNGNEAIELYKIAIDNSKKFDVVFMDLTIPGSMGGKKAVQELLNIDSGAKVVVASGYSNDPIMANFKNYGFIDRIIKPFKIDQISHVLYNLMNT